MSQTRMSISVDEVSAAAIRTAAERAGLSVSAFVERATMLAVDREERLRAMFAAWDAADAEEFSSAEQMTDEQVWQGTRNLPAEELGELRAQLVRATAASLRRTA